MLDAFLQICGAISVVGAAFVLLYKGYRLLLPVNASISYTLNFDGKNPDSLSVTVTNSSTSSVYVRSCKVRCTYSFFGLVLRHLRKPFLAPRLYPNLRYNSAVYELMGKDPIKLEPGQLVELKSEIYEHPLNALYGPMLIALVELTSGRVVRSRRMPSPPVWRMIGRRNRALA
jgi:hypothetical protein